MYNKYFLSILLTFFLYSSISNASSKTTSSKPLTTAQKLLNKKQINEIKREAPNLASAINHFYYNENDVSERNDYAPSELLLRLIIWDELVGLNWNDIENIPETNYPSVMKDVVSEGGKRLCFSGVVRQIQVDRSLNPPVTTALIHNPKVGEYITVLAVKSSKGILPDSRVGFCGVVVGINNYQAMLGYVRSPYLFGMFNLPENIN